MFEATTFWLELMALLLLRANYTPGLGFMRDQLLQNGHDALTANAGGCSTYAN